MAWESQVVLITGAARGIGRTIAERLAADGAQLALADILEKPLAETADSLRATGTAVEPMVVDVTRRDKVTAMVERTVA